MAKARWYKCVPEDNRAGLTPPGWFDKWQQATWATDPQAASANSPALRAPMRNSTGKPNRCSRFGAVIACFGPLITRSGNVITCFGKVITRFGNRRSAIMFDRNG
jgi:hypothetical protein